MFSQDLVIDLILDTGTLASGRRRIQFNLTLFLLYFKKENMQGKSVLCADLIIFCYLFFSLPYDYFLFVL